MEEIKKEQIKNEEPKINFEQFKEQMHEQVKKEIEAFKIDILGNIIKELNKEPIKQEEPKKEKTIKDLMF